MIEKPAGSWKRGFQFLQRFGASRTVQAFTVSV